MDDPNAKLKKAVGIAAAFVGWAIVTVFIMIGIYQLMAGILGWNPYASGTFAFIVWLIILVTPPVMISNYLEEKDD